MEARLRAIPRYLTLSYVPHEPQAEAAVYKDAYDMGVLIVAAAGNRGNSVPVYPASYPTVMSIGAVDRDMKVAGFSQHNSQVELSAPGVDILSTSTLQNGNKFTYAKSSGTGYAVPHVSAIAVKLLAIFPQCSNYQMRNILLRSSLEIGSNGCDEYYGYGIVQAKVAYDMLLSEGCNAGGMSGEAVGGCNQLPDTNSPTPSPTLSTSPTSVTLCEEKGDDFVAVTLSIQTDGFGSETSWKMFNGTDINDESDENLVLSSSDGAYDSNAMYVENYCVRKNVCTFVMYDSFGKWSILITTFAEPKPSAYFFLFSWPRHVKGDGMCCNHGNGFFNIKRQNSVLSSAGLFGLKTVINICEGDDDTSEVPTVSPSTPTETPSSNPTAVPSYRPSVSPSPAPSPLPSLSPSRLPSTNPSRSPTVYPSNIPSPSPSLMPSLPPSSKPSLRPSSPPSSRPSTSPSPSPTSCDLDVVLTIRTGAKPPVEITWNVVQFSSNKQVASSNGIRYDAPNTMFQEEFCLPKNCYVFTLKTDDGDDDETSAGEGKFSLLVNDVPLESNGGTLNKSITYILFGGACL